MISEVRWYLLKTIVLIKEKTFNYRQRLECSWINYKVCTASDIGCGFECCPQKKKKELILKMWKWNKKKKCYNKYSYKMYAQLPIFLMNV